MTGLPKSILNDDFGGSRQGSPIFMTIPGSINPFIRTSSNITEYKQFEPLRHGTNYASIFAKTLDIGQGEKISSENERLLKMYYEYRSAYSNILHNNLNSASNSYTNLSSLSLEAGEPHRHGSLTNSIDASVLQSEKQSIYKVLNEFLVNKENKLNPSMLKEIMDFEENHHKLQSPFRRFFSNYDSLDDNETCDQGSTSSGIKKNSSYFYSAKPYLLYYKKPLSVKIRESEIINRHNLWMPIVKQKYQHMIKSHNDVYLMENSTPENKQEVYNSTSYFRNKVCPLFIKGLNFVPQNYDTYSGTSIIPSIFSEYKMPAIIYHTSVELNGNVYIIGGLSACYRYDEEAPRLNDFYVNGIKNLPAPVLGDYINNPSLISNPFLFVFSTLQSRFSRPEFSGNAPPPLICAKGSAISDRYIFFYGGFEIKTETQIDENGKYYLKKKVFVNNLGYILDTETYKFTKIEVVNTGDVSEKNKIFYPRFGHLQVSVNIGGSQSCTASSENISLPSSRRSSSHQIHQLNSALPLAPTPIQSARIPENATAENPRPGSTFSENKWKRSSDSKVTTTGNLTTYKCVNSVYIFGGYTQTEDDQYQALDDLWKIDVQVLARGKRGFLKFGSQAKITSISRTETWPSARGFTAYTVAEVFPPMRHTLETNLLTRLKEQYKIDTTPAAVKAKSIFGNVNPKKRDTIREGVSDAASTMQSQISSHVSLSSLLNETRPGAGTPNSVQLNSSLVAFQMRMRTLYNSKGLNLVMHGGSDHDNIYGDLWMFDFVTEVWTKNALYGRETKELQDSTDQDVSWGVNAAEDGSMCTQEDKVKEHCELVPIDVRLAGHEMAYEGHVMTLLGGVTPRDVDALLHGKESDEARPLLGENTVNIFDMETSTLEGYKIRKHGENYEYIYEKDTSQAHSIMTTAGSAVHVNGSIYLVGGLIALRSALVDLRLRATILRFILPPISLSY